MRLTPDSLDRHVTGQLSSVYFVFGAEPLLIEESCDVIRKAAREQGYDERLRYTIDTSFDWSEIYALANSPSLFAMRRVVELRLPSARLADTIGKLLDVVGEPDPDTLYLLIGGRIEKKSFSTKWFKNIEDAASLVECPAVPPERMVGWLASRLHSAGLTPAEGVAERMAWFLEGNLLAAAQEIERLKLMHDGGELTLEQVEENLSDHARFSVYGWVDALLAGRVERALRILAGLQREGTEPVLILWALSRQVRALASLSTDLSTGMSQGQAFKKHRIWSSRERLIAHALKRFDAGGWTDVLSEVSRADRIFKGRAPRVAGRGQFEELERLSMRLCHVPVESPVDRKAV